MSLMRQMIIQSTLSKKDTFRTSSNCLSQRDVHLIESQNKGREERKGPTLGVRFTEVSDL